MPEGEEEPAGCMGIGETNETVLKVRPFRPRLEFFPVTHAVPFPEPSAASQVQARIVAGLMDKVLSRVEEFWKKSKSGICLSIQEIAEVGRIFGAKALDDVKLVFQENVKGHDSSCKKQARALRRLLTLSKKCI